MLGGKDYFCLPQKPNKKPLHFLQNTRLCHSSFTSGQACWLAMLSEACPPASACRPEVLCLEIGGNIMHLKGLCFLLWEYRDFWVLVTRTKTVCVSSAALLFDQAEKLGPFQFQVSPYIAERSGQIVALLLLETLHN